MRSLSSVKLATAVLTPRCTQSWTSSIMMLTVTVPQVCCQPEALLAHTSRRAVLQVGYVMQVSGQQLGQDVLDCLPDYELAFDGHCEDGYSAYYQCKCTSELNHRFGDMMYKIQDLEVGPAELLPEVAMGPALQKCLEPAANSGQQVF